MDDAYAKRDMHDVYIVRGCLGDENVPKVSLFHKSSVVYTIMRETRPNPKPDDEDKQKYFQNVSERTRKSNEIVSNV